MEEWVFPSRRSSVRSQRDPAMLRSLLSSWRHLRTSLSLYFVGTACTTAANWGCWGGWVQSRGWGVGRGGWWGWCAGWRRRRFVVWVFLLLTFLVFVPTDILVRGEMGGRGGGSGGKGGLPSGGKLARGRGVGCSLCVVPSWGCWDRGLCVGWFRDCLGFSVGWRSAPGGKLVRGWGVGCRLCLVPWCCLDSSVGFALPCAKPPSACFSRELRIEFVWV